MTGDLDLVVVGQMGAGKVEFQQSGLIQLAASEGDSRQNNS